MDPIDLYDAADRERFVDEPPKRVAAPERTPFERDRARVVHAAASRRLAAKTQVVGPQSDDFVRNRLTHSLEVAQIARDLSRALGCEPDIVETAALAHDLGHPPFGHNGERVLAELSAGLRRLRGQRPDLPAADPARGQDVRSDGRLGGAQPDPRHPRRLHEVPVAAAEAEAPAGVHADGSPRVVRKFGVYDDDRPIFDWVRAGVDGRRPLPRGAGDGPRRRRRLLRPRRRGRRRRRPHRAARRSTATRVWATVREWYLPEAADADLDDALAGLRAVDGWPDAAYDGSRRHLAALKNLTSDLIGRFCGAVQDATFAAADGPFVRYRADLVVPAETEREIAVLKGIAAHYVMRADDRVALMARQRELLGRARRGASPRVGPDALDTQYADDWRAATDDAGRRRAVIDQVASLTDASARRPARPPRLSVTSGQVALRVRVLLARGAVGVELVEQLVARATSRTASARPRPTRRSRRRW